MSQKPRKRLRKPRTPHKLTFDDVKRMMESANTYKRSHGNVKQTRYNTD